MILYAFIAFRLLSNKAGVRQGYYLGRHNRKYAIILAHETAIARMQCASTPNFERHEIHPRVHP